MNKQKIDRSVSWWQPSLILFGRMSGWIGGPIVMALFLGKWLDEKYKTEPWLFLLSIGVAFIISTIGIVKDAMNAMNKIDIDAKKVKHSKSVKVE